MTYFPKDIQNCVLKLKSAAYSVAEMDITISDLKTKISKSSEWAVLIDQGKRKVIKSSSVKFPILKFNISLMRRSYFYDIVIILPCFALSLITGFQFLLPLDYRMLLSEFQLLFEKQICGLLQCLSNSFASMDNKWPGCG